MTGESVFSKKRQISYLLSSIGGDPVSDEPRRWVTLVVVDGIEERRKK